MSSARSPLHIFLRHCYYSSASAGKGRPDGFSRQELLNTLEKTIPDDENIIVTVFLDEEFKPQNSDSHFSEQIAKKRGWEVVKGRFGSEAKAFKALIHLILQKHAEKNQFSHDSFASSSDFILQKDLFSDEIICILEDDYQVAKGWCHAAQEGTTIADYITLYDHPDKYNTSIYPNLTSILKKGDGELKFKFKFKGHWRTTPSTTNSFICKASTLKEDADLHFFFSQHEVTQDHQKFLALWGKGRTLMSSLPAFWSHQEIGMMCDI